MKYTEQRVNLLLKYIADGRHSIKDVCKMVDIDESLYYIWKEKYPDFKAKLAEAETQRLVALGEMAISGLAKRLDIYAFTEESTEFVEAKVLDDNGLPVLDKNRNPIMKPKVKSRRLTKKYIMPSDYLIKFTLCNRYPDTWKDKNETEITPPTPAPAESLLPVTLTIQRAEPYSKDKAN